LLLSAGKLERVASAMVRQFDNAEHFLHAGGNVGT
jgi:phosphate uptake regulator